MPPMNTAQASAMAGGLTRGASQSAQAMNARFSKTGVNAGTEKRLQVLRTAPANAVKPMKKMYGNVMRNMSTVMANLLVSAANPGALT